MSLLDDAIWWHVYPLGAAGAPIRGDQAREAADPGEHRLLRLIPWLDYAVELGCSGVLLGPIFESASHGYDTLDHMAIDRRLGSEEDFEAFMAACRERGLNVMLDGVFNHVAATHPRAEELALRQPDGGLACWEGHSELLTLDHSKPAVVDFVADIMLHWLRKGISGWRLDVAYAVPPRFWAETIGRVRGEFPNALFLGEVIHGDYAQIVADGRLDTVTQYELWKAIWSSIKDVNFWELAWALDRQAELCRGFVPQTFVGNHDVTRIASQIGETGAALAAALLFTLPGMPSIYYGDERGVRGDKGEGITADDGLRPALPPEPGEGDRPWIYRLYQDLIGLRRRHPWIARGEAAVLAKDNSWIEYEVRPSGEGGREGQPNSGRDGAGHANDSHANGVLTNGGHANAGDALRVRIDLTPSAAARITDAAGNELFAWRGPEGGFSADAP